MRTEVIVAFVLVAATPASASKSCMTMAEARQQFATSHLYWHGAGHCWDSTPPRQRLAHHIKAAGEQQAQRVNRQPRSQEPKWRDAMSEMLAADAPVEPSSAPTFTIPDEPPRADWLDRWIDVAQVASPVIFIDKDKPADISPTAGASGDPVIGPVRLILMFIGLVMTFFVIALVAIEFLFRKTVYGQPR